VFVANISTWNAESGQCDEAPTVGHPIVITVKGPVEGQAHLGDLRQLKIDKRWSPNLDGSYNADFYAFADDVYAALEAVGYVWFPSAFIWSGNGLSVRIQAEGQVAPEEVTRSRRLDWMRQVHGRG
jgi:hypothetical protein